MPTITYDDKPFDVIPGETVLDALHRGGVPVPCSCRAGACQTCLLRATGGTPPAAAQQGLTDALKAQGYFLSCACKPAEPMTVALPGAVVATVRASVVKVAKLGGDVARLLLACHGPFDYRGGQFVHLVRPADGLSRSYSAASIGGRDPHLELHVRKVAGGRMSNWLHDEVREGDELEVRGPAGNCFYVAGKPDQPILLAGTGTGLAPLYAVVRDALAHGHAGPIHLYHGARDPGGLYLVDELAALAREHSNLTYVRCALDGGETADPDVRVGSLDQILLADHKKLAGWRVYLCGNPAIVQVLRKKTFLAGARTADIFCDAFSPAAPAPPTATTAPSVR
jgi:CDP-4-dehydro-6-deoxyglucose reductase